MVSVPDKVAHAGFSGIKIAQIVQLVKDNQLLTAAVLFILWQIGAIAEATSYVGGVC